MTAAELEAAFVAACREELAAPKPGNVHVHAAGHGMTADDFERSALAAAPPLCQAGASLGTRILGAVAATRAAAGQNTNLGIVLLCAPLALAAQHARTLPQVLAAAGVAEAALVFRAIALAAPGGLGEAARHDVGKPATVPLIEAMAEAAGRDRIARQYATAFADLRATLLPVYAAAAMRHPGSGWAALATFLTALAAWPDSHVARKHGDAVAAALQAEAAAWPARLAAAADPADLLVDLLAWDAALKRSAINPGTSADLTVATAFAWRLQRQPPPVDRQVSPIE